MFLKIATGLALLGLLLGGFLSLLQELLLWARVLSPSSFVVFRLIGVAVPLIIYVPLMLFVAAVFLKLNKEES